MTPEEMTNLKQAADEIENTNSDFNLQQHSARRVLVIDDSDDVTDAAAYILEYLGFHVDIAKDPFEAMNRLTDRHYDCVVLDWNLPGMQGGEALSEAQRQLALEPEIPSLLEKQKTPVIIFSAVPRGRLRFSNGRFFQVQDHVEKKEGFPALVKSMRRLLFSN